MASQILDFENNWNFWENWAWKIYLATNYDGATFPVWDGTNEDAIVAQIESAYTFEDFWFFDTFAHGQSAWDSRVVGSDYCWAGEIMNKVNRTGNLSFNWQEVYNLPLLAKILGWAVKTDAETGIETLVTKKSSNSNNYQLIKFVSCPKNGKYKIFYFIKYTLDGDINITETNLDNWDFSPVAISYVQADSGNWIIKKNIPVSES
jgi:hypothetical protein